MAVVKLIRPIGEPDLAIIDADRASRGLPPSTLVWVCQHSCAEADIPDCQDFNCEAMTIVDPSDAERLRALVAQGQLAAFERVDVRLQLGVPCDLCAELQSFARGSAERLAFEQHDSMWSADGSLLAFARLCGRQLDPALSDQARSLLLEIERTLVWQFSTGGPALFRQRFGDLRTRRDERGNVITFLASADWPAPALVAWEEPRARRRNAAVPAIPEANVGFGRCSKVGELYRLDFTDWGLAVIPGDLYGPTARLVFRVDQEAADHVRQLCQAQAGAPPASSLDDRMLALLASIAEALGLALPARPEALMGRARPAQFIRRLLLAQPLPPAAAPIPPASPPPGPV